MVLLSSLQLEVMVALIGACVVIAFFIAITKGLPTKKIITLVLLELTTALLLLADRAAYLYRGDVSKLGYWMVRLSNFSVFLLTIMVLSAFGFYLVDLFQEKMQNKKVPLRLKLIKWVALAGIVLLVISQFTGLYYTFDASNHYVRSRWFMLCYLFPVVILGLELSVIIQLQRNLSSRMLAILIVFSVMPFVAAVLQVFAYGLSLINIFIAVTAILLYVFAILDINESIRDAHRRERELIKDKEDRTNALLDQTAKVLASAIDAKDKYTHGHSSRVAQYSKEIAFLSGKSEQECEEIYYAALVHDVGKIGISDAVINKKGRLTEEEYEEMKKHPVIGKTILENANLSPFLQDGAYSHHERYDGKGYPEGKKGEETPEIARIIAVADAYDAMTSKRSYRDPLPQEKVRNEIENGIGTQFDPTFAGIMLRLIDADEGYAMREHF